MHCLSWISFIINELTIAKKGFTYSNSQIRKYYIERYISDVDIEKDYAIRLFCGIRSILRTTKTWRKFILNWNLPKIFLYFQRVNGKQSHDIRISVLIFIIHPSN